MDGLFFLCALIAIGVVIIWVIIHDKPASETLRRDNAADGASLLNGTRAGRRI
jgi:hypothetical protein